MRPGKPCCKGCWHGSPDRSQDHSAAAGKQGEWDIPSGILCTCCQIRPPPVSWLGAHLQLHLPSLRIPVSPDPVLDHTSNRGQWASSGRSTVEYQEWDQAGQCNETGPCGE